MKMCIPCFLILHLVLFSARSQEVLAPGAQPQITTDSKEVVRLVYGQQNKIYYSMSGDKGLTFSTPILVAEVSKMHLGMTRGPQLATSRDFSIVTAMDQSGNIHSFTLIHKTGQWQKIENVNDVDSSAPEGLMSIAADDKNNFYAVWLDLREDHKNNICFSSLQKKSKWSANHFAYRSPDGHVCECCKPSIAVKGDRVSIMFRNWFRGSRDIYLINSSDRGQTFSAAQKLGHGTWPLKGCPMDGGGLALDSENNIHTAWQRERVIFYAMPGKAEQRIGDGRSVGLSGNLVTWQKGSDLILHRMNAEQRKIGEGTGLQVLEFKDQSILAVWEQENQIVFKKL
jgi:hypothetical protein